MMETSLRKLEHSAALEKAITVYGQPENCTAACKRIMEVRSVMILMRLHMLQMGGKIVTKG